MQTGLNMRKQRKQRTAEHRILGRKMEGKKMKKQSPHLSSLAPSLPPSPSVQNIFALHIFA